MLLIRTFLQEVAPREVGLFAGEDIKADVMIWQFDRRFDKVFSQADVNDMPPVVRESFLLYAYLDLRLGYYVSCGDDAKFMRHSETPNISGRYKTLANGKADFGTAVSNTAILKGEQLTSDYREFDADYRRKMSGLCAVGAA